MTRPVRTILHVDLDAFFAAVEVRERPELKGKPVVIGADPKGGCGRGVVSTASYEARVFGVHSALPITEAWRRCPQAVYLRPRMELYLQASRAVMDIMARYTDLVEPLSIDEAFLDVTASRRLFGAGEAIARSIQSDIERAEHITGSIGVAPCKFLAKIASDLEKPCGRVIVRPGEVERFLDRVPIRRLWGAGPRALEEFGRLGVATIGDVSRVPLARLQRVFSGKLAQHFHDLSRGIDPRPVEPDRVRKSLGREHTFMVDVDDRQHVEQLLFALVEDVARSLRRSGLAGRTVTVKLRTGDFHTVTRSATSSEPLDTTERIWPVAKELLRKADSTRLAVRLVGVSLTQLGPRQEGLFERSAAAADRRIATALDTIQDRFGARALRRARLLDTEERPTEEGS